MSPKPIEGEMARPYLSCSFDQLAEKARASWYDAEALREVLAEVRHRRRRRARILQTNCERQLLVLENGRFGAAAHRVTQALSDFLGTGEIADVRSGAQTTPAVAAESPYVIVDLRQGTQQWLEWRRNGLGASDAPVIMKQNRWKGTEQLLHDKLHGDSGYQNHAMIRGHQLEPEARQRYRELVGRRVKPACLQSTRYQWLRASVDGLSHSGRTVVEIKCGESCHRKVTESRSVPRYYYGQLQHILAVTGLPAIDFFCHWPGRTDMNIEVPRDDRYIERLLAEELEFWQEVLRRRR